MTIWVLLAWLYAPRALAQSSEPIVQKVPSRPNPKAGPTRVSVGLFVIDVDSIDSAAQSFVSNVFCIFRWKDPRLAHGKKYPKRYDVIDVWTPQMQIANETGIVRMTLPEIVEVSGDGVVVYRQRFVGPFSDPLDLRDFPFDTQNFQIHFASVSSRASEIQFVPDEKLAADGLKDACGISEDISLPDWIIESYRCEPEPYQIVASGDPQAGYAFTFIAARGARHYVAKVIIPLALIVFMSWTVFWIDPSQLGTQISVATTSMLTLIAYRFAIATQLPKVPYTTRLDSFMLFATFLVFLALVLAVVTPNLSRSGRQKAARKIDLISRVIFPVAFFVATIWIFLVGV